MFWYTGGCTAVLYVPKSWSLHIGNFIAFCLGVVPVDFIYIIQVALLAPAVVSGSVKRPEIMGIAWIRYKLII